MSRRTVLLPKRDPVRQGIKMSVSGGVFPPSMLLCPLANLNFVYFLILVFRAPFHNGSDAALRSTHQTKALLC